MQNRANHAHRCPAGAESLKLQGCRHTYCTNHLTEQPVAVSNVSTSCCPCMQCLVMVGLQSPSQERACASCPKVDDLSSPSICYFAVWATKACKACCSFGLALLSPSCSVKTCIHNRHSTNCSQTSMLLDQLHCSILLHIQVCLQLLKLQMQCKGTSRYSELPEVS